MSKPKFNLIKWFLSLFQSKKETKKLIVVAVAQGTSTTLNPHQESKPQEEVKKVLDSKLEQVNTDSFDFLEGDNRCVRKLISIGKSHIVIEYCEGVFFRTAKKYISPSAAYDCNSRLENEVIKLGIDLGFCKIGSYWQVKPIENEVIEREYTKKDYEYYKNVPSENVRKVKTQQEPVNEIPLEVQVESKRPIRHALLKEIEDSLTDKQKWMLVYCFERINEFVSPTSVGRAYGKEVKNKQGWGSQHASKSLTQMVAMGLLEKNEAGHYKIRYQENED